MIHPARIQVLHTETELKGEYVLYWMQAAVRSRYNHALEYAIELANAWESPLLVCFGLTPTFPEANRRHYAFLLEGLREVQQALEARGIPLVVRLTDGPWKLALELSQDAAMTVTDRGYLRIQREWREKLAREIQCPLIQVESEAVVPIEVTSQKEEYAARTIRPRIHKHLDTFLVPLEPGEVQHPFDVPWDSLDLQDPHLLDRLPIDQSVPPSSQFRGGEKEAQRLLQQFIEDRLAFYLEKRSDPSWEFTSGLSPYLHYGHISPLDIALQLKEQPFFESVEAFLEELIVRRELSFNFCHFNPCYDQYACLPDWCKKTLNEHRFDEREHLYDLQALENAQTADPYWNAAHQDLVVTGKMPGYMRMYWGKKVLEWAEHPEDAFEWLLYLNNKYSLDGRDPNSFAGVAWCFGKHDRPWTTRPIFGSVRYMNAGGLERKFDMRRYLRRVGMLVQSQD